MSQTKSYNQKDHRHCFIDQTGHEKHLTCCLCSVPQVPHKPECCEGSVTHDGLKYHRHNCPIYHDQIFLLEPATPTTSGTEQGLDELVRDLCSVGPKIKSKVRARLVSLLATERKEAYDEGFDDGIAFDKLASYQAGRANLLDEIEKLVTDEIATAHKEGIPTARLTSLYMKLTSLKKVDIQKHDTN